MTKNSTPAMPGDVDPRHVFLTTKEVIVRFGWGRTYGYLMLKSTGFPRPIGGRYRLDAIMAWEDRVLSGKLPGVPDKPSAPVPGADNRPTQCDGSAAQPDTTIETTTRDDSVKPVEPPRRRRTRGTRRAA